MWEAEFGLPYGLTDRTLTFSKADRQIDRQIDQMCHKSLFSILVDNTFLKGKGIRDASFTDEQWSYMLRFVSQIKDIFSAM